MVGRRVTKRRIVGAVIGLVLLLAVTVAAGVVGAPSVVGVDNAFGEVTEETTVIETDLIVQNPNPIRIPLGNVSVNYTVSMNAIALAEGRAGDVHLPSGNTTLEFVTEMSNERIPEWWPSHVRRGERTRLSIDAEVRSETLGASTTVPYDRSIETDLLGQFNSTETRPVNADEPLVEDPVLYVNETGAWWGDVTSEETPMRVDMLVYNPRTVEPYVITELGYEITMNDITVGEGLSEETYTIPAGETETIETRTAIRNDALDEWWVSHLQRDQVTDLRITFWARVELPTGSTVRIPLDELTYEERIETDIFGEGGGSSPGAETPAANATAGGDSAGTETAEVGEKTATRQPNEDTPTDGLIGGGTSTASPIDQATPTPTPGDSTSTPDETATPAGTPTPGDGLL